MKETGIRNVKIINDLNAVGYGMISLQDSEVIHLYDPKEELLEDTIRLVVGLGTGLGAC